MKKSLAKSLMLKLCLCDLANQEDSELFAYLTNSPYFEK